MNQIAHFSLNRMYDILPKYYRNLLCTQFQFAQIHKQRDIDVPVFLYTHTDCISENLRNYLIANRNIYAFQNYKEDFAFGYPIA